VKCARRVYTISSFPCSPVSWYPFKRDRCLPGPLPTLYFSGTEHWRHATEWFKSRSLSPWTNEVFEYLPCSNLPLLSLFYRLLSLFVATAMFRRLFLGRRSTLDICHTKTHTTTPLPSASFARFQEMVSLTALFLCSYRRDNDVLCV
jgi:hypothetical protein